MVNAKAYIRSTYIKFLSPVTIPSQTLQAIWAQVMGKFDRELLAQAFGAACITTKAILSYDELEALLIQGMVLSGVLISPKTE
jgi:hypothetical protein